MGQPAKELPPEWKCYTEAEVQRIVSAVLTNYRQACIKDFESGMLVVLTELVETVRELRDAVSELRETRARLKQDETF